METPEGLQYKFDIRAYGLIVKVSKEHPHEFYLFNKYLNRRSMSPYSENSTSTDVMLTNTTQAGISDFPIESLTSLGGYHITYDLYEKIFEVYNDICLDHFTKFDSSDFENPSINIIGMDFIFDQDLNPYILEINKFPAIHCDEIKRKKFHHGLEESMFDKDFFDITFESILNKTPYMFSTDNYFRCV